MLVSAVDAHCSACTSAEPLLFPCLMGFQSACLGVSRPFGSVSTRLLCLSGRLLALRKSFCLSVVELQILSPYPHETEGPSAISFGGFWSFDGRVVGTQESSNIGYRRVLNNSCQHYGPYTCFS